MIDENMLPTRSGYERDQLVEKLDTDQAYADKKYIEYLQAEIEYWEIRHLATMSVMSLMEYDLKKEMHDLLFHGPATAVQKVAIETVLYNYKRSTNSRATFKTLVNKVKHMLYHIPNSMDDLLYMDAITIIKAANEWLNN